MELKEFNEQMARLNETYNNYYTKERKKTIWSIMCNVDAKFFEKKVTKTLWADFPPKIDWFQKIRNDNEKQIENENTLKVSLDEKDLSKFSLEEITNKINELRQKL